MRHHDDKNRKIWRLSAARRHQKWTFKIWCWAGATVCVCVWGVCALKSFVCLVIVLSARVCVCRTNMPLLSLMKGQPGESTLRGPRSIFGLAKRINLPHALPDFFHCLCCMWIEHKHISGCMQQQIVHTRTRNWPQKDCHLLGPGVAHFPLPYP